jgi:hypothetical protein
MAVIALLTATSCWAQEAVPPQSTSSTGQEQASAPAQTAKKLTIIVPAGTRIPVKLTYSLWSKTARAGDAVHAVTVFPVTVDTTVAIPEGTYVEGVIDKVWRRPSAEHPALQMHFARLFFANGYTVPLEGATTQAKAGEPGAVLSGTSADGETAPSDPLPGSQSMVGNGFAAQQSELPPAPKVGPNMGIVTGVSLGATAALIVTVVLLGHHRGGYTLLDAGSQVEMVLQNPLALDAEQVAAALATPSAQ